eukprot:TRINITY_DN3755_c0_g1_i1.p1 TRINITY_DN3755_c0_g1~~TRINITY_DN3755_c0_g1_i1.p1  ORF type:complete len:132 (-),score=22.40 TRINITY_DN3755_c0_g1_i1:4-399(-)
MQALMKDVKYEHKICGMYKDLAITVRTEFQQHQRNNAYISDAMDRCATNLKKRVADSSLQQYTVAVMMGGPIRTFHENLDSNLSTIEHDIIIYLLSDPTDIDSKQITFIHTNIDPETRNKIFNALYKYNPL